MHGNSRQNRLVGGCKESQINHEVRHEAEIYQVEEAASKLKLDEGQDPTAAICNDDDRLVE